jgi:transmembrane sensor
MAEHKAARPQISREFPGRWRWIAALTLLAVLCGGIGWLASNALRARSVRKTPSAPETVVSTDIGERGSAELADGTRLTLNTNSRVRAHRDSRRIVVEKGEVVAVVPPSSAVREYSDLPVVFDMPGVDVEAAAATQLRIRMDADGVVLAGESQLKLLPPQRMIEMIAGQTALIKPGDVVVVTEFEPSQLGRELSWQDGEVWLKGQTIEEAIAEFNRYNHRKLVVLDKQLAARRVGGRFATTDVEGFVNALRHLFGVRVMAVRSGGRGASTLVLVPEDRGA